MPGPKIMHVTDPNMRWVHDTVCEGVKATAYGFGADLLLLNADQLFERRFDKDSSVTTCIIEAAYPEAARMSISELRRYFPTAKIVILGSDTFYHISQGSFQVNHPKEVDLWLDLMTDCANEYSKYTKTDTWSWTISGKLLKYLQKFKENHPNVEKKYDFISVLGSHTVNRGYRKQLIEYLGENGISFTRGNTDGYSDPDMDKLYLSYLESRFCLGTTSHDNVPFRSAKGFRDSVSVSLGIPLFYDRYKDVERDYPNAIFYDYYDFESLVNQYCHWTNPNISRKIELEMICNEQYHSLVNKTIETILISRLIKHKIL